MPAPYNQPQSLTLAAVTKRVDRLLVVCDAPIKKIVNSLKPEDPFDAVLFDPTDPDGMEIHRELGFEPNGPETFSVMDIRREPFEESLRRHEYRPLDESGYEPGTVLLYVFTMGVVVVRRFAAGGGAKLREVRMAREVQFEGPRDLQGLAALEIIVQRCVPLLRQLRQPGKDRVALIQLKPHGANVRYITREVGISSLREPKPETPDDIREAYRTTADELAAGSTPNRVPCLLDARGSIHLLHLEAKSLLSEPLENFNDDNQTRLLQHIAACHDQKRALGFLKKCLEKMGPSPVKPLVAELVRLVREDWKNHDAILAGTSAAARTAAETNMPDEGNRVRGTLIALTQATTERKRGFTGPGGDA